MKNIFIYMNNNQTSNKICTNTQCSSNNPKVSFIITYRNENSFYLYCEDCREDILNDDDYEIIKINDNQKEVLIQESQELIDKLNKQLKRLYQLQDIKCDDYGKILKEDVFEVFSKLIIDFIEKKKLILKETKDENNFLINKNYEILIDRIEGYINKLNSLNLNEQFECTIYKQSIRENLNIIKNYIDQTLEPIFRNYKNTKLEESLNKYVFTQNISNSIEKLIDESIKSVEMNISGSFIECEQIIKHGYKQICTNIPLTQEIITTKYLKYFPNDINQLNQISAENFTKFNNCVQQYIQKSNIEYLRLMNSDYYGFVIRRELGPNGLNLYILVVEALQRIFSGNFINIKINSICEGTGNGKIDLLFSNGQIRRFNMSGNTTYEDSTTTTNPQNFPINKVIKVIARLLDVTGNSFEAPIYFHGYNFSIIYNSISYVYFYQNDGSNQGLNIDNRVKSLLDLKKKDIYLTISNHIIKAKPIKSLESVKSYEKSNLIDNNKLQRRLSTIKGNDNEIFKKTVFLEILQNIFGKDNIISVINIKQGRIYGEFIIINNDKTFEFYHYKGKRAFEIKTTVKTNNIMTEKEFYFTENGYNLCKSYEICYLLPDNSDQEYDKYEINFCYELEEHLYNYIKCNRAISEKLNKIDLEIICKIETIFDKYIKIKKFSNTLECKIKGDFTYITDFSKTNFKINEYAYKIDVIYVYNDEEMIMTIFLEKNNLHLIKPNSGKFRYEISNKNVYEIENWSFRKYIDIIDKILKTNKDSQVKDKIEIENKEILKASFEIQFKEKIEAENKEILNRTDNANREKMINIDETNCNLDERKIEILEVMRNLINKEIKEIDKFEDIDNFNGKLKVMRRDGMNQIKDIKCGELTKATILGSNNLNTEILFVKDGMNPIIEIIEKDNSNIQVESEAFKMLTEASKNMVEKLQFKNNLFEKEEMKIKTFEDVKILLDKSGSMTKFLPKIRNEIADKFGQSKCIKEVEGCSFTKGSNVYNELKNMIISSGYGDAIYFIADFQDSENTQALEEAKELEEMLIEKQISLYLHSVDRNIYPILSDVSVTTGGWSIIYKDF